MASLQGRGRAVLLLVTIVLMWVCSSSAAVYNVGDRSSWTLPSIDYNNWARSKPIRVNDVLRFAYSAEIHNVMLVSKADYDQCATNRPVQVFSDGNSMVRLTKRGTYYFICGVPGHCQGGMKMAVTVR